LKLPKKLLARYFHLDDVMEECGPEFGMLYTRSMGDGLFELRIKAQEGIARVFYGVLVGKKIIILHCFIKKTQKTPSKELKIAKNRLKEVLNDE
jgi:phage-related protein